MVGWLWFLCILFLASTFFHVPLLLWTLYLSAGIYIIIRIWNWRVIKALDVQRILNHDHAFLSEAVPVTLTLSNPTFFPILWVKTKEILPSNLATTGQTATVVGIPPKRQIKLHYQILCRKRGYYLIGPLEIETGDCLGFEEQRKIIQNTASLIVYPNIVPLEKLFLASREPFGVIKSQRRIFADPSRFIGVRDYHRGDSLRTIHWKTTARVGKLQVKKYEPAITMTNLIFLNLNYDEFVGRRKEYQGELGITIAASLTNYFCKARQLVGLSTNGMDPLANQDERKNIPVTILPEKGVGHLMKILEVLARIRLETTFSFVNLMGLEIMRVPWGASLIVITPSDTQELRQVLYGFRRLGYNVTLILGGETAEISPIKKKYSLMGIGVYAVAKEEEIGSLAFQK